VVTQVWALDMATDGTFPEATTHRAQTCPYARVNVCLTGLAVREAHDINIY
jgi:hypothetical protein